MINNYVKDTYKYHTYTSYDYTGSPTPGNERKSFTGSSVVNFKVELTKPNFYTIPGFMLIDFTFNGRCWHDSTNISAPYDFELSVTYGCGPATVNSADELDRSSKFYWDPPLSTSASSNSALAFNRLLTYDKITGNTDYMHFFMNFIDRTGNYSPDGHIGMNGVQVGAESKSYFASAKVSYVLEKKV